MFSLLQQLIRNALATDQHSQTHMNADKAVTYAAVKYCVDKISSHIAQCPLNLHKITKDRNEKQTRHMGYSLLRVRPNRYQTPYVFKRQLMVHGLLWGNARAYIWRDGMNVELIPLMPDRTDTFLIDGEKVHIYKVERDERLSLVEDVRRELASAREEKRPHDVVILKDADVLHWHGLGFDGIAGKSVVAMARQSWSLGLGQEATELNRQKKGYSGGMMLNAPPGAFRKEEDAREFLKEFRKAHAGEHGDGIGMLREGITAQVLAMSNTDAQFLESRKFQVEDVLRWFAMPTMPGDNASVSYNSLEQKNLTYRIDCLGPWMTAIEEECEIKLLTPAEIRNGYYFKFNDGAILRTDKQTTANIGATLIRSRVVNPNEVREWFEMNPYDGGDEFENPAITTGAPGTQSETSSNTESQSMAAERRARVSQVEQLIGVEVKRVVDATKARNFCDKLDKFYAKWEVTLANRLESAGMDRDLATAHCDESKERLLAIADVAMTQEYLRSAVIDETETWENRAIALVEEFEATKC